MTSRATTLADLRKDVEAGRVARRSVKSEVRDNLIRKLRAGETLFPGIIGYDDSVVPQVVNAILSRHNFILLGLRGQAKTRILRALTTLLDEWVPVVPGCEIHDDPLAPLCAACRKLARMDGDGLPIEWLHRDHRYVEKLATPDVTIADIIGDLDPIKAARASLELSDEMTMHYGLVPRANRGIFAINELPDLAGKIQVGMFNVMQEGDVQLKGYPVRLKLDVAIVFTANPEDYTARGKIITPLKDRIGSEIVTHYPLTVELGVGITGQEAWTDRAGRSVRIPDFLSELVERVAFEARADKRVDKKSGVSQRLPISLLENVVSAAERRAVMCKEKTVVPRVSDVYAALPAITGKLELEYEGELKGGDAVAREIIRMAVGKVYDHYFEGTNVAQIIQWFDLGGSLKLDENVDSATMVQQLGGIQGLMEKTKALGLTHNEPDAVRAAAAEFILEGLHAHKRISRNEERGFGAEEKTRERREEPKSERPNFRRQYN
jgi:magnesium chelatase subunit I